MSQKIYLHVKEPCHENWEAMSAVQQGRYCQSCAKQVVDFSQMSDQQILDVLSKAAGKTCGRFTGSQLERPVGNDIPYSLQPYKIVLSSLVPLFITVASVSAQNNVSKGEVAVHTKSTSPNFLMGDTVMTPPVTPVIMGKFLVRDNDKEQQSKKVNPVQKIIVKDKVVNKRNPVRGHLKSALQRAQINTTVFNHEMIALPAHDKEYKIKVSDPVTVTGFDNNPFVCTVGEISIVRTVTRIDTAKAFVQKVFNQNMFKAYPNPAPRGGNVQLTFKKEGEYLIQLFDNSGKLYIEKQVSLPGKEMISQLAIPATIGSGIYYLKAVNTTLKKSYIEKIIVP